MSRRVSRASIAYASSGSWDCPAVELSQPIYEAKHLTRAILVEGTADVDARFFSSPLNEPAPSSPLDNSPFCITVALLSKSSSQPLDWNQEDASQCGVRTSQENLDSNIKLGSRITIDKELCCVAFSISIPRYMLTAPAMPSTGISSASSPRRRSTVAGATCSREFGVAVKAYDASGRVTQTNIARFVVTWVPPSLAIPASATLPKSMATQQQQPSVARRSSVASKILKPVVGSFPFNRSVLLGGRIGRRRKSSTASVGSARRRSSGLSVHHGRR